MLRQASISRERPAQCKRGPDPQSMLRVGGRTNIWRICSRAWLAMPNLHVLTGAGESPTYPIIRKIGFADLKDAAAKGIADFWVMPTHVIFLAIIYPIVGLFLARMTFGYDVMPLLFPLAAGFALIGPFAAIGLYELSRQREKGVDVSWKHAFGVLRCRSLDGITALGMVLMIVFLIWLMTAQWLYQSLFGYGSPESIGQC